jgi:DNA-directed RNA polymerase sigma subunit (sigma70/sigma32)
MDVDDPLAVYLKAMGEVSPLSPAEEFECIEHLRREDEMAETAGVRLVETHLAMVVQIAERHRVANMHILDLVQEGNTGLLRAVEMLKTGSDQSFGPLAATYVESAIKIAIANHGKTELVRHRVGDVVDPDAEPER